MIIVHLPYHLQTLAGAAKQVEIDVIGDITVNSILDTLEDKYPPLKGTIREHGSGNRRAYLRFFACGEDISHQAPDISLHECIVNGKEPFIILGAIAGG